MKLKNIAFGVVSSFLFAANALYATELPKYIPDHLKQFEETNSCVGCDLTEAKLIDEQHEKANLTSSLLSRTNLAFSQFNYSDFSYAKMTQVIMMMAQSYGSSFRGAVLIGANLYHANLGGCDFTGANLKDANLSYANLVRAKISQEQLTSVRSLHCAILPDGSVHAASDEDCHLSR